MSTGHESNVGQQFVPGEDMRLTAQNERREMQIQGYGEVISFDAPTQRAKIKIMRKPRFNGIEVDAPDLVDVPVHQLRGGGFAITYPLQPGDKVLLTFDDKDNKLYLDSGAVSVSDTDRLNSLSDAVAHPGSYPVTNPVTGYDSKRLFLGTEDNNFGRWLSTAGDEEWHFATITANIDKDVKYTIGGAVSYTVAKSVTHKIGGSYTRTVGGAQTETVSGKATQTSAGLALNSNGEEVVALMADIVQAIIDHKDTAMHGTHPLVKLALQDLKGRVESMM